VAVNDVFADSDTMQLRDQIRAWGSAWRLRGRGLMGELRRRAGAAALAASAALALHFGLIESPSRPTAARYQVGYQCWRNVYDCRDFRTQAEAQAVYLACGGPKRDVHHLDWHGNGRACDHLP
jgi:hypothetical protein